MKNFKLLSLLRATMKGQMNIFRTGNSNKKNAIKNIASQKLGVIFLTLILMGVFGMYAMMMADPLSKVGLTYIIIILFALITSFMIVIQGLYYAQGILFEAKDNDMLFAMPIKKSTILASRLIKLFSYEYIWNALIMIPTFAVYVFIEKPQISFYLTALVIFICLPIIPTILVSIIGYIVQAISSRMKFKNFFQIVFSMFFLLILFYFSFNLETYMANIAENAKSLNEILLKIYYPLGIYEQCILEFNLGKLLLCLGANLLLIIIYTRIFSITYFKIISRLSEKGTKSNFKLKTSKANSQLMALFKKELKRYFSSSIYVMNTVFGQVLLFLSAIYLVVSETGLEALLSQEIGNIDLSILPKALIIFICFVASTATTTASSISLEGKSFSLTKSLPIKAKDLFLSKILVNLLITIPLILISVIIYSLKLKMGILDILYSVLATIIFSTLTALWGLVVNLKYPKMDAKSDTIVVKQSMSIIVTMFTGFILTFLPLVLIFAFKITNLNLYIGVCLLLYTVITIFMWKILNTYGIKMLNRLT